MRRATLQAGLVHAYTASGVVLALLIVLAAIDGDEVRALALGIVALFVDGTDGMLARRYRVKEVTPGFDGAKLDDIVDYLTYVFAPVVLLLQGDYLPDGVPGLVVASVPLLASAYQFCQADAKTDDHTFTGFPSYWNVVAFYAVVMDLGPVSVTVVVLVCGALVPVPLGWLYPSRTPTLRTLSLVLSALWLVTVIVLLVQVPDPSPLWLSASLAYVVYYTGVSLYLEATKRAGRRALAPS